MFNSAIGLETGKSRTKGHDALQAWMAGQGLQPYLPQLAVMSSYNIGLQYDVAQGRLKWPAAALEAVRMFEQPLVFHYNGYHYAQQPGALRWGEVGQDALPMEQMAGYLGRTLAWLKEEGVQAPWMLVDEPPYGSGERWSQAVEDRVVKFVKAARAGGWTVGGGGAGSVTVCVLGGQGGRGALDSECQAYA